MHKLEYDDQSNLLFTYEKINQQATFLIAQFCSVAGFQEIQNTDSHIVFKYSNADEAKKSHKAKELIKYINKHDEQFGQNNLDVDSKIDVSIAETEEERELFKQALENGAKVKEKTFHEPYTPATFKRDLLPFQKESVEHMLTVQNSANFSVPGSGKTTIAYAAIANWLDKGIIEKIMVIGPSASFLPWREEFEECFGKTPDYLEVRGKQAEYLEDIGHRFNLFLMHYATSHGRRVEIGNFLRKHKTVLIVDESHNIKSPQIGKFAEAALVLGREATRRIILTGTPMPNNAKDLWTQLTFLWPRDLPLGNPNRYFDYVKRRGTLSEKDNRVLHALHCRIKKDDLGLPKPDIEVVPVKLRPVQRKIYNAIAAKTLEEIESLQDQAKLHKFRIARMVRLLQAASNPSMLYEKSHTFDVTRDAFGEEFGVMGDKKDKYLEIDGVDNLSVWDLIKNYSDKEIPAKLTRAYNLAKEILDGGEKVIIWSAFKHNMEIFRTKLFKKQYETLIVNGDVDMKIREERINKFKNESGPKVLIATAASLGESVSLHKNRKKENVCRHAIYLDRNYNGAQYMQSMDRIHRVGMDTSGPGSDVKYYLLVAGKTIDEKIHTRLNEKWEDMTTKLNDPFVSNLNLDAYGHEQTQSEIDRDYDSMVNHLRELAEDEDADDYFDDDE